MLEAYADNEGLRAYIPDNVQLELVEKAYLFNVSSQANELVEARLRKESLLRSYQRSKHGNLWEAASAPRCRRLLIFF